MIQRACQHLDAARPLTGWRRLAREDMPGDSESAWAARGEEGVPRQYFKDTWVSEGELDVEIHINSRNRSSPSDPIQYQVLIILLGKAEWFGQPQPRSQPVELFRPLASSPAQAVIPSHRVTAQEQHLPQVWTAIGTARSVPQFSDNPACTSVIQEWSRNCLENHPHCTRRTSQRPMPSRVLDVSKSQVRLLETDGLLDDYVTLSYCWGPPTSHRLVTLRSNLASHILGIEWEKLSKTHQDAITMTRRLGKSYIWVSAMVCIIMHDS